MEVSISCSEKHPWITSFYWAPDLQGDVDVSSGAVGRRRGLRVVPDGLEDGGENDDHFRHVDGERMAVFGQAVDLETNTG